MKIKLVNVYNGPLKEIHYGTCEICMGSYMGTEEHIVFEDENGYTLDILNGFWDWGDFYEYFDVENWAEFSQWLKDQDWDDDHQLTENFIASEVRPAWRDKVYEDYDLDNEED